MTMFRRLIRDRSALLGLIIIAALILVAIFAYPLSTFPQDVTNYDPPHRLLPPSATYWFGTDRMGADASDLFVYRADAGRDLAEVAERVGETGEAAAARATALTLYRAKGNVAAARQLARFRRRGRQAEPVDR